MVNRIIRVTMEKSSGNGGGQLLNCSTRVSMETCTGNGTSGTLRRQGLRSPRFLRRGTTAREARGRYARTAENPLRVAGDAATAAAWAFNQVYQTTGTLKGAGSTRRENTRKRNTPSACKRAIGHVKGDVDKLKEKLGFLTELKQTVDELKQSAILRCDSKQVRQQAGG